MDGQQIYALLGQWYDVVGRSHGGHGGRGMGRRRHHGWGGRGYGYGYGDYGNGYDGYDDYDQNAALWAYLQQLQQQMQQQAVPVPVPVPAGPPVAPPTAGWIGAELPGAPGDFPFPPRAAVVDAPLPTQANRDILPMSTGVPILPTQSAQITGRPQTLVFKIGRFVISNAGTAGGAADWIVNDIKIGNRSQFVQSGDVPGDLFATNAIDTFVRFEAAQTAMDVVVVVTYIGLNESGCPFFGAMVGTAAV